MTLLNTLRAVYQKKRRQGWQLQEIAEISGIHQATILRIVKGDTLNPGVQTVEHLIQTLRTLGTRT